MPAWEPALCSAGPQARPAAPQPQNTSPSAVRTCLLFVCVCFNQNFPCSFLALQSHPLLTLNPTQAGGQLVVLARLPRLHRFFL